MVVKIVIIETHSFLGDAPMPYKVAEVMTVYMSMCTAALWQQIIQGLFPSAPLVVVTCFNFRTQIKFCCNFSTTNKMGDIVQIFNKGSFGIKVCVSLNLPLLNYQ